VALSDAAITRYEIGGVQLWSNTDMPLHRFTDAVAMLSYAGACPVKVKNAVLIVRCCKATWPALPQRFSNDHHAMGQ